MKKITKRTYTVEYACGCTSSVRVSLKAQRPPERCQWHDKHAFRITDETVTVFDVLDDEGNVKKRHKS